LQETVQEVAVWAFPVLVAIIFHEVAHGWVAFQFGDSTAARMGRLTLNPISHIDLFGTILLPFFLIIVGAPFVFGYAKPVPVNFHNLHHPKRDMIWVAGAGPATNILIAVVSIYLLKFLNASGGLLPAFVGTPLALMAQYSVMINAMLAAFNLLPLPPLDGGGPGAMDWAAAAGTPLTAAPQLLQNFVPSLRGAPQELQNAMVHLAHQLDGRVYRRRRGDSRSSLRWNTGPQGPSIFEADATLKGRSSTVLDDIIPNGGGSRGACNRDCCGERAGRGGETPPPQPAGCRRYEGEFFQRVARW